MKRDVFCLFALVFLLCGAEGASAQKRGGGPESDGVTIGGKVWATRNVGAKGKFVKTPQEAGKYYTFEEAQSVCPKGWRTPTASEFDELVGAGSEWTVEGKTGGRRFGKGTEAIFLPAAGAHFTYEKAPAEVDARGHYWSSDAYSDALGYDLPQGAMAYNLRFDQGSVMTIYHNNRAFGYPVRCVRAE